MVQRATGEGQRPGLRQRACVLGLTLLVELAVVLLIIWFGGSRVRDAFVPVTPTSIVFVPNERARSPVAPAAAQRRPGPRRGRRRRCPRPPTPPADPAAGTAVRADEQERLRRERHPQARHRRVARRGQRGGPKTAAGAGEGPGGVTLYNAEWVREPSDAELRTYLPRSVAAGSWALIACQTIAHNQVENCAQLGESPRGSGLSKAMRLAAWQFRVRPPRVDGKPMVGAWVRIRIDFGKEKGE